MFHGFTIGTDSRLYRPYNRLSDVIRIVILIIKKNGSFHGKSYKHIKKIQSWYL